ncbi:hypothetical protein EJB05_45819 [Eragrostis curvula]|uniref:Uncharacterized protein n=1 Tax=Eragrostis curvula TaxID=38414 RepID=A0A5J9TL55_9POAL|nr:hypothetical protein EJB05_45819 [Eragrostis curvula]
MLVVTSVGFASMFPFLTYYYLFLSLIRFIKVKYLVSRSALLLNRILLKLIAAYLKLMSTTATLIALIFSCIVLVSDGTLAVVPITKPIMDKAIEKAKMEAIVDLQKEDKYQRYLQKLLLAIYCKKLSSKCRPCASSSE